MINIEVEKFFPKGFDTLEDRATEIFPVLKRQAASYHERVKDKDHVCSVCGVAFKCYRTYRVACNDPECKRKAHLRCKSLRVQRKREKSK